MVFKLGLLFLVWSVTICESANILYIVPFSAKSHNIMLRPIGLELARRGHNVTVITAHKEKNPPPNYQQVIVDDKIIWEVLGIEPPNIFDTAKMSIEEFYALIIFAGGVGITEVTLNTTDVQKFLAKDNSFDLVISEQFYQEALNILAYKYKAPLVLISTFGNCMKHNIITRNPLQLGTTLQEYLDLKDPTSFWGRLRNVYFSLYEYFYWRYLYLPKQEAMVKKYIPNLEEPVPSLYEMQQNVAMMLVNGHFTFDSPIAYLPNIVEIGGVHLTSSDAASEMSPDLKQILDKAVHGVIYMSFGSNIRSIELPTEKRDAFIKVFSKLKQKVLWKWEDDNLPNKPDNLIVRKWLPQREILAHPNVKLFIAHGGLIGTQEAIFHGVPIIGIPIYADQYNNLLQIKNLGFGRILEYNDINEQTLHNHLNAVLRDDSYKKNATEASKRFKDRPMSALDTAMFWIEYVIRHKGAEHMKNPALSISWLAYTMLDVYAFIAAGFLLIVYIISKVLFIMCSRHNKNVKLNKKKKQ